MRKTTRSIALLACLVGAAGCTGTPSELSAEPGQVTVSSFSPIAAATIRGAEAFQEPIYLEIWGGGPTAVRLEARGYLRAGGREGHYELTEKADAAGAWEDYFQDNIPVYYFPIGQRELVEIRDVSELPATAGSKRVLFSYRKAPNRLGAELLESGSSLREIESGRLAEGRAFFIEHDDGWRMGILQL